MTSGYVGEPQTVNLYQCGGSLIAPGVILTAAHCAAKFQEEPTKLKIRCGEWDTQNQTEPSPHQDRYVQALDIHPEFNPRNLANDWAVLYTAQNFDLQAHIDTICLPQPEELFDFQSCFATGWGKDQFGAAGNYQVVLKEIDLPVVGHDQCEASLRTTRLGKRFKLDDSFICAGGVWQGHLQGRWRQPPCLPEQVRPNFLRPGWHRCLGYWLWRGQHSWCLRLCVQGCLLDRLRHVLQVWPGERILLKLLGLLSSAVPDLDGRRADQAEPGSCWHAKRRLPHWQEEGGRPGQGGEGSGDPEQVRQCNVFWQPIDAAPLTTGGNGYVDGGDVDISNFERDNYPAAPLTDGTDGYSEP